jgi:hypothetical protein
MWYKLVLSTLFALVAFSPAWADDFRQPRREYQERRRDRDDERRRIWRYDVNGGGAFEHQRGRLWLELRRNGRPIEYREVDRTPEYVELYDARRDLRVRIHDDVYYSSERGRRWSAGAEGRWD